MSGGRISPGTSMIRTKILQKFLKSNDPMERTMGDLTLVSRNFQIDNVAKYVKKVFTEPELNIGGPKRAGMFDYDGLIYRLPYSVVLMEYFEPDPAINCPVGLLMAYREDGQLICNVILDHPKKFVAHHLGTMLIHLKADFTLNCSDDFSGIDIKIPDLKLMNEKQKMESMGTCISLLTPALYALQLLNCKNVRQVESSNHEGLSKRERKSVFREDFHILDVPLINRIANGEIEIGIGGKCPLHTVRGHFKTFTAEKPLLGRHVGMYWWEDYVRGSIKNGIVSKEYQAGEPEVNKEAT